MNTNAVTVLLDHKLEAFVEARAKERGYRSVRAYLRALVREDEHQAIAQARWRAKLMKGFKSRPGRPAEEVFAELRRRLRRRQAQRRRQSAARRIVRERRRAHKQRKKKKPSR